MASGQATSTKTGGHVCKPPRDVPVGWLWPCPDCWSQLLYRPVFSWELGRVINLWVRHYEPPKGTRTPHTRRRSNECPPSRSANGSTSAAKGSS